MKESKKLLNSNKQLKNKQLEDNNIVKKKRGRPKKIVNIIETDNNLG